jgi:hypothetical protein
MLRPIEVFRTLIPKNAESLFVIEKSNKIMCFSLYRKLIRPGLTNIGIDLKYNSYLLKHAAIDELFRLNLTQQINKITRFNYGITYQAQILRNFGRF